MVVLIDTKYFGAMFRNARKHQNLGANDVARILNISLKQLHRYEHGLEPIPENILDSVFYHGLCLLRCKKRFIKK